MISGSLVYYFYINKGLSKRYVLGLLHICTYSYATNRTETILQKLIILSINQGVLLGLDCRIIWVLWAAAYCHHSLVTITTLVLVSGQPFTKI